MVFSHNDMSRILFIIMSSGIIFGLKCYYLIKTNVKYLGFVDKWFSMKLFNYTNANIISDC